eukprot:4713530-Amphidinium_carterae.1
MDPTPVEAQQLNANGLAAYSVEMPPDVRSSLFAYSGVQAIDHPRLLAALPHVDNYLDLWLFGEVPPSPALRARAGFLVRACRLHGGFDPNYEPQAQKAVACTRFEQNGCAQAFESRALAEAEVRGPLTQNRTAMITKEQDGHIKWSLIVDCRESG